MNHLNLKKSYKGWSILLMGLFLFSSCKEDELPPDRRHIYENGGFCERTFVETAPVVTELDQILYPFTDSNPNLPSEELTALGNAVGEASLVGLGEATHGTHQFFEMKDRIFRYLVENHDFKAIGFEATWGGALYVNDYVVNGNGNSRDAIAKMQFWTWDTEEVQTLVEWMYQYNLDKPDSEKIYFYGFDMQSGIEEEFWIEQYLTEHDPELNQDIIGTIKELVDIIGSGSYGNLTDEQRDEHRMNLQDAQAQFEAKAEALIAGSSQSEYDLILKAFDVLLQYEDIFRPVPDFSRDYYMAENSEWIRDYIGGGAKVALWAHNLHVTKDGVFPSQGEFLDVSQGEEYKNIGFSFSSGTFQALNGSWQLNTANEVTEVRCNSTNELFSSLSSRNFFIVSDDIQATTHSKDYFSVDRETLDIGAVYDESSPNSYYFRMNLTEAYDVIIHFDRTTAANPLP